MAASTVGFWQALGDMESFALATELQHQTIDAPIFVSGMARSGSTILTEVISQHPQIACHHYSDFPMTWIPYWWNRLRGRLPLPKQEPRERAHRDRLLVTGDSPEAIEEVLWMRFFPEAHRADRIHVMDQQQCHPKFEKYYRDHIRKLLLVRSRQRYLAKNNYHATRIEYLLKLFPDARIIIPIRDPVQQVASLIKQHDLFSKQNAEDSRVSRQLQMSAHYEFGPLRCPIIVNESRQAHYRNDLEEVAWYATQWADIYGFLHKRMTENQELSKACLVVRYEDICTRTRSGLNRIFAHLGLDDEWAERTTEAYDPIIQAPDYYRPGFSKRQQELIRSLTGETAESFAIA